MGNTIMSPSKSRESADGLSEKNKKSKGSSEDPKPRPGKLTKSRRTTNPFIIFFLRLRSKKSHIPVTKIARIAGKRWTQMNDEQRQKYVDLANAEKKRREGIKRKRVNHNSKIKGVKSRNKSVYKRS